MTTAPRAPGRAVKVEAGVDHAADAYDLMRRCAAFDGRLNARLHRTNALAQLARGDAGDKALRWFRVQIAGAHERGRARITGEGVVWRGSRPTLRPYGGIPAVTAARVERLRGAPPRVAWRAAYSQERRDPAALFSDPPSCVMAWLLALFDMGDQPDADDAWRAYLAAEKRHQPERVQLQAEQFTPFDPYEEAA